MTNTFSNTNCVFQYLEADNGEAKIEESTAAVADEAVNGNAEEEGEDEEEDEMLAAAIAASMTNHPLPRKVQPKEAKAITKKRKTTMRCWPRLSQRA